MLGEILLAYRASINLLCIHYMPKTTFVKTDY